MFIVAELFDLKLTEATSFHSWRVFMLVCILPVLISIGGLCAMPESPRFLLQVISIIIIVFHNANVIPHIYQSMKDYLKYQLNWQEVSNIRIIFILLMKWKYIIINIAFELHAIISSIGCIKRTDKHYISYIRVHGLNLSNKQFTKYITMHEALHPRIVLWEPTTSLSLNRLERIWRR